MSNQWPWIIAVVVTVGLIAGIVVFDNGGKQNTITDIPESVTTVSESDWTKGNAEAPVTIIEYSDLQCPACANYYPMVKELVASRDDIRFVYRHFPLSIHRNGDEAARAAEAAGLQGKFWEMHDMLFEQQAAWSDLDDPTDTFAGYAESISLNVDQFKTDLDADATDDAVDADRQSGSEAGVSATPTFIVNGTVIENPRSLDEFVALVEAEKSNGN